MWNFNIEEKDAEFRDDLRAASGVGRSKKARKLCAFGFDTSTTKHTFVHTQRGRRTGPVLSQQVRAIVGEGNQAYIDGNVPEAMRIMQEVIRIEPRAPAAWTVLASCYEGMNELQKGLQLRVMAAHLTHDADAWEELAQKSK